MCGIAGYLLERPGPPVSSVLATLREGVRQRGPDDHGACLIDRSSRRVSAAGDLPDGSAHDMALINTRFAIIDPSPAGHQPFRSADGTITLVFNGEIYNHLELRRDLEREGVTFRTACDTEVLAEGYRFWGDALWGRLNGFWAVALFDAITGAATFCRDRLGIAPLYMRQVDGALYFASSIAPLRRIPPATAEIDEARVCGFIETALRDFDRSTLFTDIRSLPPATVVRLDQGVVTMDSAAERRFWEVPRTRLTSRDLSLDEAANEFRDVFFDAVALRLRSDVPVAFELSGGLDSSSVVAAAAAMGRAVVAYTIEVPEHNEEPYARQMLTRHRLDYRVLRNPEQDFMGRALEFSRLMEEPFHSPNIYTHFQMRRRMKAEGVDVVLSGSGGDEVLAGYEPLFWRSASRAMRADGDTRVLRRHRVLMHARQLRSPALMRSRFRRGVLRLRRLVGTGERAQTGVASRGGDEPGCGPGNVAIRLADSYAGLSWEQQRAYHFETGLLPYYLSSNDRFTMAIPVEHRFPFLDYRVVELGLRMPPSYLFRNGWTKYVLRKAMSPYLPDGITWRRDKMGFPFAYDRFLSQHRDTLEPFVQAARSRVPMRGREAGYEEMLRADPVRLWRICSAGLWLESLDP